MKATVIAFALTLCGLAQAYPEMIRHNYVNCGSCHASPHGGGALTAYGRELSKDILSTWSTDNEHEILPGVLHKKDYLSWIKSIGGDFRAVQMHVDNEFVKSGRWLWMQADAELVGALGPITSSLAIGRVTKDGRSEAEVRKAYGMINLNAEHLLRVGLYTPTYGLNIPEHVSYIKSDLRLAPNQEAINAEYTWLNEQWTYVASVGRPRPRLVAESQPAEIRWIQQLSYAPTEHHKVGVGAMIAAGRPKTESVYGAHALVGFSERAYALLEFDWLHTEKHDTQTAQNRFIQYQKLGYEVFRGFHLIGLHEQSSPLKTKSSSKNLFGAGMTWFPRPHFEFQLAWNRVQNQTQSRAWGTYAWLLLHYYL